MDDRQKDILTFVINQYIRSAQPIGSALLTEKSGMDLSSATFRNELATLEEEGFLEQPHTSAGRVPTEKAYQYYVNEILHKKAYHQHSKGELKMHVKDDLESDEILKTVAKQLVEKSDQAVIVALDKEHIFYTGLSNLFAHPEFADQKNVVNVSGIIDKVDKIIGGLMEEIDDLEIMIGKHNPFGESCSSIMGKYKMKNGKQGLFAIVGPMRMDYEKNIHLLNEVKMLLESNDVEGK